MKALAEHFKRDHWKSPLLVCGMILMAMPLSVRGSEVNEWQKVRDDFLQGDLGLLQFHCDRGENANRKSI